MRTIDANGLGAVRQGRELPPRDAATPTFLMNPCGNLSGLKADLS
jgi:hypothetical protein